MKDRNKVPYSVPKLEQHTVWVETTGVSLPIGTNTLDNPLEMNDFMEEQQ
jgi:hypothetical protein